MGILCGAVSVGAGWAQVPDVGARNKGKPIEITADALEVIQENRLATFTGNVEVTQGDMRMTAQTMQVHYHPRAGDGAAQNAVSRIEVDGDVFLATPEETAHGDQGVYDVDAQTVELTGNVVLTRAENMIKGEHLVYNIATGKSRITSEKTQEDGQGRVRGVFVPGQSGQ